MDLIPVLYDVVISVGDDYCKIYDSIPNRQAFNYAYAILLDFTASDCD
jgi:hypothetical protein